MINGTVAAQDSDNSLRAEGDGTADALNGNEDDLKPLGSIHPTFQ
jgi:hypothetical protein